jgi:hypothetical protein
MLSMVLIPTIHFSQTQHLPSVAPLVAKPGRQVMPAHLCSRGF